MLIIAPYSSRLMIFSPIMRCASVAKGTIVRQVGSSKWSVSLSNSNESMSVSLHKNAGPMTPCINTPVLIVSNEIVAIGTANPEGKIQYEKFICVHPEQLDPSKFCSNCPRRIRQ